MCILQKRFSLGWILLCSLLLFSSCKETAEVHPVVETEDVSRDNIEIHGYYVGSIRAYRNVEIHARVEGYLERMTFEEGKRVEEGEPLFYINNDVERARVERARAMRLSYRKLYDSARSYHQLAQLQYINGIVAYLDVLDAQRQLFDAEIALNDATLLELIATVDMYKALGGGIER